MVQSKFKTRMGAMMSPPKNDRCHRIGLSICTIFFSADLQLVRDESTKFVNSICRMRDLLELRDHVPRVGHPDRKDIGSWG